MLTSKKNTDTLQDMFSRLPEKRLPDSFRESVMQKVMQEAVLMKKREERLGLLITITISCVILALGAVVLFLLEIPAFELRVPDMSAVPFYTYIGTLVLLLLVADHKFRKRFYEKHSKQQH